MAYRKTYVIEKSNLKDSILDLDIAEKFNSSLEMNESFNRSTNQYNGCTYYHTSSSNSGLDYYEVPEVVSVLTKMEMEVGKMKVEICPLSRSKLMVRFIGRGQLVTDFENALGQYCKFTSSVGG